MVAPGKEALVGWQPKTALPGGPKAPARPAAARAVMPVATSVECIKSEKQNSPAVDCGRWRNVEKSHLFFRKELGWISIVKPGVTCPDVFWKGEGTAVIAHAQVSMVVARDYMIYFKTRCFDVFCPG